MRDADGGRRDAVLDGVRGMAIGLVLIVHCIELRGGSVVLAAINALARSCWLGVDLFFVLSGFLITRILIESRAHPGYFRNFYARRALRIFPAYYLYLAIAFLLLPGFIEPLRHESAGQWLWPSLFYVQNIVMAIDGEATPWRGLNHLWSLAVEEQFYLIWPLLVWATPLRWLKTLCVGMIGMAWALKLLCVATDQWHLTAYALTPTRMDALAAGAWVAAHLHGAATGQRLVPRWLQALTVLAVLGLAALFVSGRGLHLHGSLRIVLITSAAAIMFATALLVCVGRDLRPRWLLSTPMQVLGRYSYGIYLIHLALIELVQVPLQSWLVPQLGHNAAAGLSALVVVPVIVAVAALMYHVYEAPFLRLKRYFSGPAVA